MSYRRYALAFVAMAAMGLSGAAQAQNDNGGDGIHSGRHGERTAPRRFDRYVDHRQARQGVRIRDGRRDGELNRRETHRLRHDRRQVNRLERKFGSDGRYSPRERKILDRKLDRNSRHIKRAKNNDRPAYGDRGGRHGYGKRGDRHGYRGNDRGRRSEGRHSRYQGQRSHGKRHR
jgi:hypothetical protein